MLDNTVYDTISIPVEGAGDDEMSEASEVLGDIDQDCAEALLESVAGTHEALMADVAANSEMAGNIVRLSGARKFNREDPIEAAAAEKILKGEE
jgi:hypothetical protein